MAKAVGMSAAVALEHRVAVWHAGRDFEPIGRYTALETCSPK